MRALLAGVKLKSTFGTRAQRLGNQGEQRAALGAAGNGMSPSHLNWLGAERVLPDRSLRRRFLALPTAVLISVLAILAIGQSLLRGALKIGLTPKDKDWNSTFSLPQAQSTSPDTESGFMSRRVSGRVSSALPEFEGEDPFIPCIAIGLRRGELPLAR